MSEDALLKVITESVEKAEAAGAGETAHSSPSAVDASALPPAATPDKAVEPAAGGERVRGPDGKFAAKTEVAPSAAEKKTDAPAETATGAQAVAQQPAGKHMTPPANWKGGAKVKWDQLPEPVRREISEDYAVRDATSGELARYKAAIGNRAETLAASYGSVEQGLQNLFAISDMATKNPAGFIQWFAQQRGVDLAQMMGQGGQAQQQPDAQNPYLQEVAQLKNTVQQLIQQQQDSQLRPVVSEIERFKADPAHPYYNDVESYIITLLRGDSVPGTSPSERLNNAYEMAIWAHPEIRKTLIEDQRNSVINTNAQTVARAKSAAGLPTGSPAGATVPEDGPKRSLEDTIRASVDRAMRM